MFGCFTCASIATILLAPCINILTSLFEKLVNLFVLAKLVQCTAFLSDGTLINPQINLCMEK